MNHKTFSTLVLLVATSLSHASDVHKSEPFVGVTQYQIVQGLNDDKSPKLPRPVVINILEIDTKAPGIRFEMSPGNGDAPGEVHRETTRAFVDSVGAQIGINVGFYDTKANYGNLNTDLNFLAASNGDVFSPAKGGEWVFDISKNNVPRILKAGPKDSKTIGNDSPVFNAGGGNQPMLHDGEVVTPDDAYTKALNPHTAIGVSRDAKKVYLVVVDGRQSGYSEGMRTDELARIMLKYGAWDAINFDGGGSTTMVMDDVDDKKAVSRLVNSPSDNSSPAKAGTDRVVANSFAVFATPKAGYVPLPPVPRPELKDGLELLKTRTVIDDFEDGKLGHFGGSLTAANSTKGIDAKSSVTVDSSIAQAGKSSLKLSLVADAAKKEDGFQLRLLSGDASPKTNIIDGKAMGNDGCVGVYLRREAGGPPLFVSMIVDEGTPSAVATERGQAFEVKADGQWHLYEWGLNEDAKWFNYNGGNGTIDGPNVFIDSLLFKTTKGDDKGEPFTGDIWVDTVTYEPGGHIK